MKKYLKALGYVSLFIIIGTFLVTIMNYFNIFNQTIMNIFIILIPAFGMIFGGFHLGKNSQKKGWLEGIKLSIIIIIFLLLVAWIFSFDLNLRTVIYYLIIMGSSMFGGMVGINKNPKIEDNH